MAEGFLRTMAGDRLDVRVPEVRSNQSRHSIDKEDSIDKLEPLLN